MRHLLIPLVTASLMVTPAVAGTKREVQKLRKAEQILDMSVATPDKRIPQELLGKAECIGVFPDVKKGAFVVGGEFGRGVFTCRRDDGTLGAPAFFTIGGPSIGWQWGGRETDLILLIMNKDGVKHLLEDHFTLGGQASAVAGPVGRTAQAATDIQLQAQILAWSRSRGAFLGASLDGTVIDPNEKANAKFYGSSASARQILIEHSVPVPSVAQSFVSATSRHARRS
jgi:lipid-binding SYLF domain-containing protein